MAFFRRFRSSLLLVILPITILTLVLVNRDADDPLMVYQEFDEFRCAITYKPDTVFQLKDTKSVSSQLQDIKYSLEILRISKKPSQIADLHALVQHQMSTLERLLGVQEWYQKQSHLLAKKIEDTIHSLQNPENCSTVPKLYCDLRNPAGLASGLHDLLWCAHNAYLNRSMLVVMSRHWHYTPRGWNDTFEELSLTCPHVVQSEEKTQWPGICDDKYRHTLAYLPGDTEKDLLVLGSNPLPWWYGHLLGNYVKPASKIKQRIEQKMKELGFKSPIVGVHIRRTDKIGTEGAYHPVSEYMAQVKNYFDTLQLEGQELDERRVFVATDETKVLQELQTKYPEYRFLYNDESAKTVENLKTRYKVEGLQNAIVDVFMISRVDYLVCSFSSGFSRLAYELMLYHRPESLDRVYSVDTEYFYAGAANPPRVALYDHNAEGELQLQKGDVLYLPYFNSLQDDATRGKVYDGLSVAVNNRTGQTGLHPLHKTKPIYGVKEVRPEHEV